MRGHLGVMSSSAHQSIIASSLLRTNYPELCARAIQWDSNDAVLLFPRPVVSVSTYFRAGVVTRID